MAGGMARYAYVSDDGATYSVRKDISNALAAGNTPDSTSPGLRHGQHPRYVLATHPTSGRERKIVIGEASNELYALNTAEAITLQDFGTTPSAAVAYSVRSRIGEKRYNR
jgi:hypothetical protein